MNRVEYAVPPIVEAVVEFRFSEQVKAEPIAKLSRKLRDRYPNENLIQTKNAHINLEDDSLKVDSFDLTRRSNDDQTHVAMIGPANFIISQLAPYCGWRAYQERIALDWSDLKDAMGYRKLDRIGVRYINRIDLPIDANGMTQFEEYLNGYVALPDEIPSVDFYQFQVRTRLPELGATLTLNSGSTDPAVIGKASFLMDIDIAKEVDVPQRDDDIFALLEKISLKKNSVFESLVKEKARTIFNGL